MGFVMPERAKVGYLDPEIANEGSKVHITSEGDVIAWTPPPPKPVMPDWSGIKSIQKYFNRTGFQTWPAWLYHPEEAPRLVKNADEAAELGVCYRQATIDERGRYGREHVWDWKEDCKWRPQPYGRPKFDPANPGHGKTYVAAPPNPTIAQNELLRDLVPLVTAAVVQAVKGGGSVAAPANVDAAQWDDFLKFQAWQKSQAAVDALAEKDDPLVEPVLGNALKPSEILDGRDHLEKRAAELGMKIDGRWSTQHLRSRVEMAEKTALDDARGAA
jgi:hypothetical protein